VTKPPALTTRALFGAACLVVSLLSGCATTPPDEDPVQIKLKDLETRLARIEKVTSNQSLLQISNQIEALRADVRAMHNDVDVLSNSLEASRKQSRDLYVDLDLRVKNLEARGGVANTASAPAAAAAHSPGPSTGAAGAEQPNANPDDAPRYQAAFNLLKDGQYDKAIDAFQKFLLDFPASTLADNAQYWLGEAYYVNRAYPNAESAFQRVVEKYPQSRKLPDALLKIGYCRYELKQWDSAKTVLTQLVSQYPDTPAGRLAQQRLEKMAAEKH
jgi:tol-pal system protein YbgF